MTLETHFERKKENKYLHKNKQSKAIYIVWEKENYF